MSDVDHTVIKTSPDDRVIGFVAGTSKHDTLEMQTTTGSLIVTESWLDTGGSSFIARHGRVSERAAHDW